VKKTRKASSKKLNHILTDFISEPKPKPKPNSIYMKFDMNTIQHLGISMYSRLPPVIGELVANSYDADAKNVNIYFYDRDNNNKQIIVEDDGHGMTFEEISSCFLTIGRNRRKEEGDISPSGRKVIGRKGIGKLAMFGIANEIIVTTIKNGIKNVFRLNLDEIKNTKDVFYYPPHEVVNEIVNERNKTIIKLHKLNRKSNFEPIEIAKDLAKRFLIFDESFKVSIYHNDGNPIKVTNELRFENIKEEFSFIFPNDELNVDYENKDKVTGKIIVSENTIKSSFQGIYLVARGKLIHENSFYDIRADDHIHSYITGYLNVDFIDDDADLDLISTNRQSLNWEYEKTSKLKEYIQEMLKFVSREARKKREQKKKELIEELHGSSIDDWLKAIPAIESKVAKKMVNAIIKDPKLDVQKSVQLIDFIKSHFEFQSFKDFAADLESADETDVSGIIQLLKDWEILEAKELHKLALVRIEAIKQFEKAIDENFREVPELHNFLKKFPWLLDPKITEFKDEQRYSKLLKETFKEDELPESDRRIDFLCVDFTDTIFVIELKRPHIKANASTFEQAIEYKSFIEEKKGNDPDFSKRFVKTIIVCGGISDTRKNRNIAESHRKSGFVHVRTYDELLVSARKYHQEFLERYEELQKKQS